MHCLVIQSHSHWLPPPSPVPSATVRVPLGVLPGDPAPLLPPPPVSVAPIVPTVLLVSPSPPAVLLSATRMPAQLSASLRDDGRTISTKDHLSFSRSTSLSWVRISNPKHRQPVRLSFIITPIEGMTCYTSFF